ncbi:MAG: type II toxin-antitoxin system VapC family toxin [Methanosphaera stadtmanae]|nr:type II toxin-antitoxin system VapC family toxin [Methanosphaera stadtmanae]
MYFIDSSFLISLLTENEKNNQHSCEISENINEYRVINNIVLSETLNGIRRYEKRVDINKIYTIINEVMDIKYLKKSDYEEAINIYSYYNGSINYSDCLILKTMQDNNINKILSYDDDFDKINGLQRIY